MSSPCRSPTTRRSAPATCWRASTMATIASRSTPPRTRSPRRTRRSPASAGRSRRRTRRSTRPRRRSPRPRPGGRRARRPEARRARTRPVAETRRRRLRLAAAARAGDRRPRPRRRCACRGARRQDRRRRGAGRRQGRRSKCSRPSETEAERGARRTRHRRGQGRTRSLLHRDSRAVRRRRRQQGGEGRPISARTRLLAIVPTESAYVDANFKETQLDAMRPGPEGRRRGRFVRRPGRSPGVVESVAPASGAVFSLLPPDNATGNFTKVVQRVPVRIAIAADALAARAAARGPVGRRRRSHPRRKPAAPDPARPARLRRWRPTETSAAQ